MITTVVCCICVMCTAVLATYGMGIGDKGGRNAEKQLLVLQPPMCIAFFLAFTSSCILISTMYYMIIKVSILAMNALMSARRRFSGSHGHHPRQMECDDLSSISSFSSSYSHRSPFSSDSDDDDVEKKKVPKKESSSNITVLAATAPKEHHENDRLSQWSFSDEEERPIEEKQEKPNEEEVCEIATVAHPPPSEEIFEHEEEDSEEEKRQQTKRNAKRTTVQANERFTSVKVWTNVYGLALGMFCIVYSLLLPNELSSFTFCVCLWLAATYECASQNNGGCTLFQCRRKRNRKGRQRFCAQSLTALVRTICSCSLLYSDEGRMRRMNRKKRIFMELQDLHRRQRPTHTEEPASTRHSIESQVELILHPSSSSSSWVQCFLCLLLVVGMVLKASGSLISGRLWDGIVAEDGQSVHVAAMLCSVLIPVMGVSAIKNMQRTKDVRSTMELSVPACSMGSLVCLLCIIVAANIMESEGKENCISSYFWQVVSKETR